MNSEVRRTIWVTALLFLATIAAFMVSYHLFFLYGFTHEFGTYAEIGRNIAGGNGYVTSYLHPSDLAYHDASGLELARLMPVANRFPLWSYFVAGVMFIFGKNDFAMALAGGISLALMVALTFMIGRRLFDEKTALLASIVVMLCPTFLKFFAMWGYACFLFGAITLWILYLLTILGELSPRKKLLAYLLIGLLVGLGFLTRPNMIVWVPAIIAYFFIALGRKEGIRGGVIVILVALLVNIPHIAYQWKHFHTLIPLAFSHNLGQLSGTTDRQFLEYTTHDSVATFLSMNVLIIKKWLTIFFQHLMDFPIYWQFQFVWPFFIVATVAKHPDMRRRFMNLSLVFMAICVAAFSLLRYEKFGDAVQGRYLAWFAPIVALFAVDCFRRITANLSEEGRTRSLRIFIACILLFFSYFYINAYENLRYEVAGLDAKNWPEFRYMEKNVPADTMIASNVPAHTAWYLGRPSLSLPNRQETITVINEKHPVNYLFISTLIAGELHNYEEWAQLLRSQEELSKFQNDYGYEVIKTFPKGILLKGRD